MKYGVQCMRYDVVKRVKHLGEEVAGIDIDNIHFAGSNVNK